jgi:hypothetical protein
MFSPKYFTAFIELWINSWKLVCVYMYISMSVNDTYFVFFFHYWQAAELPNYHHLQLYILNVIYDIEVGPTRHNTPRRSWSIVASRMLQISNMLMALLYQVLLSIVKYHGLNFKFIYNKHSFIILRSSFQVFLLTDLFLS